VVRIANPQSSRRRREIKSANDPLHGFSSLEFHGLSDGGGEVDVPLYALLSLDELDFGRESHDRRPWYLVIKLDNMVQEKGGKINAKLPSLQLEISFSILFI
jgi:hypothetical protein